MAVAHLAPLSYQIFRDSNGNGLAGGSVYTYIAGTATPQAAYTDESAGTPCANPIVLDANGGAQFWLLNGQGYKFIVKDSLGNTIRTIDNIYNVEPGSIGSTQVGAGALTPANINFATLVPSNLPANCIDSSQIKPGAVTAAKIPNGTLEAAHFDQAADLTGLTKMIEAVVTNTGDQIQVIPQKPWSAPVQLSNPNTLPANTGVSVSWSPNGEFLTVGHLNTPYQSTYQRFGTSFYKLPDPAILPPERASGSSWSPDNQFLALSYKNSPYVGIYQKSGIKLTKLPDPATIPGGWGTGCAWSRDSQYLAVASSSSPYILVYQKSNFPQTVYLFTVSAASATVGTTYTNNGSTFTILDTISSDIGVLAYASGPPAASGTLTKSVGTGDATMTFSAVAVLAQPNAPFFTKLSNPVTLPPGGANGCAWSSDGQYLAVCSGSTPYIDVYQNLVGTLTKLSDPVSLPSGALNCVAFSPDNSFLACGINTSGGNSLLIYQFSGGVLSSPQTITLPNSADLPGPGCLAWSPNGAYLAVGGNGGISPYVYIYSRSGTTFTPTTAPVSPPAGAVGGIAWSPTGEFVAMAIAASPYVQIYQTGSPTLPTDALLWVRALTYV